MGYNSLGSDVMDEPPDLRPWGVPRRVNIEVALAVGGRSEVRENPGAIVLEQDLVAADLADAAIECQGCHQTLRVQLGNLSGGCSLTHYRRSDQAEQLARVPPWAGWCKERGLVGQGGRCAGWYGASSVTKGGRPANLAGLHGTKGKSMTTAS